MLNTIRRGAATAQSRVAPVVLENERLGRIRRRDARLALAFNRQETTPPAPSPGITGAEPPAAALDRVLHRRRDVILLIQQPRHPCYRPARDDFLDEHDAASLNAAHIKPEIRSEERRVGKECR